MAQVPGLPFVIPPDIAVHLAGLPDAGPRPSAPRPPNEEEDTEDPPGYGPDPDYAPDAVEPEPTPPLPPEPAVMPEPGLA